MELSEEEFLRHLKDCTAAVLDGSGVKGTSFFVAPGLLITCAHVVYGLGDRINIRWKNNPAVAFVERVGNPRSLIESRKTDSPDPDLALLRLTDTGFGPDVTPPCVLLEDEIPKLTDSLYSFGHAEGEYSANGEAVILNYEGPAYDFSNREILKLREGNVRPGMSGAPVLNRMTGRICGVMFASRDIRDNLGGRAIPSRLVFSMFPNLRAEQDSAQSASRKWIDLWGGRDHVVRRLGPFATVPPLPPTFLKRPDLVDPLREIIKSSSAPVELTGMGGVGKTMTALGLCHDAEIRKVFPDGIVWLTIGRESITSVEERIRQVALALNEEFAAYSAAAYRTLLADKAVLVVLDDVWTREEIKPFILDIGRSRLLYTSRDKSLARHFGADYHEVGILGETEARLFLARWSGREPEKLPEPYASGILRECKGLPLGLAMIGGALRGAHEREWPRLLTDLKKGLPEGSICLPGRYGYETLRSSIAVSVNALNPAAKARYLKLAVLLEDLPATETLLQALWGGTERDVQQLARQFVDHSLANWDAEGNMRLHDFQLDYVRNEHHDPAALALVHAALRTEWGWLSSAQSFASQMTWRLLAHAARPSIATLLEDLRVCTPRPWLRPLRAALNATREWNSTARRVLIKSVALTADCKRAVTSSEDATVQVWDLEGKGPPHVLKGHKHKINSVSMSADGRRAISGSDDGAIMVWDFVNNEPPRVLKRVSSRVTAVALTADGRSAVFAAEDKALRVLDLDGERPLRYLRGHTDSVNSISLSVDGGRAVSGSYDRTLMVWDLWGKRRPVVLEGHTGWVCSVASSTDGKRAASGSYDKTVRVWDLDENKLIRTLEGHSSIVYAVALSPDGKRAVSGSDDDTIRLWDLENGTCLGTFGCNGVVLCCAWTGNCIVAGDNSGELHHFAWEE